MPSKPPFLVVPLFCLGAALPCLLPGPMVRAEAAQIPRDKALIAAIDKGDRTRVDMLLAGGADPNAEDDDGDALIHAIRTGSVPLCETLLRKGAQIEGAKSASITPLLAAIFLKKPPIVKLLLEKGADIHHVPSLQVSPLATAAGKGQTEIMQMLLDKGAKPDIDPQDQSFPLGTAAAEGQKAAIEFLLAHGSQVNTVDTEGESALILAAEAGSLEAVEALLAHGARTDITDNSGDSLLEEVKAGPQRAAIIAALKKAGAKEAVPSLFKAAKKNNTQMLRTLLEQGADPNEQDSLGRTPLFYAVKERDPVVLKALLNSGANPNARDKAGKTPVDAAQAESNTEAITLLVAGGAYVPAFLLNFAVQTNDLPALKTLLAAGVDPNLPGIDGSLPLTDACSLDQQEMVRLLIEHGAKINSLDPQGMSPLMHAVLADNMNLVRFLLEKGADAKLTGESGMSALTYASQPGSLEMVRLLIEHGTPVMGRVSYEQRSVFAVLAASADAATLRFLLDHGALADLDTKDKDGDTPLTIAAQGLNLEAVQFLLERGANPNIVDSVGETPLHYTVTGIMQAISEAEEDNRHRKAVQAKKGGPPPPEAPEDRSRAGTAILRLLVKHGAKLEVRNKAGQTPLQTAQRGDCTEAVLALRQLGARWPTPHGAKDLMAAVEEDDLVVVKRLLSKGVAPNITGQDGFTPLMLAALRGDREIAEELLNHGARPDFRKVENGYYPTTPLLLAAESGAVDIMRLLLKRGANPNVKMGVNNTALSDVVGKGQWAAVRLLVEAGMDVNGGGLTEYSPVVRAALIMGGLDTMRLLLAKGARVKGRFPAGITPLMVVAEGGRADSFQLLLKAGADLNARSDSGDTVLMYAVRGSSALMLMYSLRDNGREMIHYLLALLQATHADINVRNKQNKTALSFALDRGENEIVELLKVAGAKE